MVYLFSIYLLVYTEVFKCFDLNNLFKPLLWFVLMGRVAMYSRGFDSTRAVQKPLHPNSSRSYLNGEVILYRGGEYTSQTPGVTQTNLQDLLSRAPQVFDRRDENSRIFDEYIDKPFIKGVTERETGRSLLMIDAHGVHHSDVMVNQFKGADGQKNYGNTIRWISIGDNGDGMIGVDYWGHARTFDGCARNLRDVRFVVTTLLNIGFSPKKPLFLVTPGHIQEHVRGKRIRNGNVASIGQYAELPRA